ncbi:MutS-related protein [Puia dinghuensis]|uniref:DNA mismatch repair proteins mutS family domain-containing protein n=1 Tax=Puia dinghuensis TaxID=1792502 RepID=A0A8J2XQR5_9BACT|nr:hypothetical protein [Puia dinghuensis]GGA83861.1 hypothetical protein GCM10011511_03760 [Puia dinghuensis]
MSTEAYYQENIAACNGKIRSIQTRLNGMALVRVALFAGVAFTVYSLIQQYTLALLILAMLLTAAFIGCVNLYYRWKDQRSLQEKLRFVLTNEVGLLTGASNRFPDGAAFLTSDTYLDDLDIFGKNSLFHVLNRTTTARGMNVLAARLRRPLLDPAVIVQEQQAVRILAAQTHLRPLLTAHGLLIDKRQADLDKASLAEWLDTSPHFYRNGWLRAAIIVLPVVNIAGLLLYFTSNNFALVVAGIIVSRLLLRAYHGYVSGQHRLISHKQDLFDQYAGILAEFNKADTTGSPVLQHWQSVTKMAHTAIHRLSRLTSFFDQRLNLVVNVLLNTFFLYDLHCIIALESWKDRNRSSFPGWIEAVGAIEQLNSLATFAFNNPDYVYPSPMASGAAPTNGTPAPALFIESTSIAHPLIPAVRRVANDFTIGRDESLILVTGSNMSGKTTFLRTIGINLLMAQCGLPVCAATFTFTPMDILTSLRISDSLQEQTSYFMAELKKLQQIILHLRTGAPALVLIDEILRGTNSEDKTSGSEQFIRQLLQYRCLSLFATHDLSLGTLEQPGLITNYCFESVIDNGELHFNYLLQRGIARNRNASFLMKKMDII